MNTDRRPILVWMRNSLRVTDNALLTQAARAGSDAVPFLCTSDGWSGDEDTPRRRIMRSAIAALDAALRDGGSALFMLGEDPLREIPRAASSLRAEALYVTRSVDPRVRRRDGRLGRALAAIGCPMHEIDDTVIFGRDAFRTTSGTPYTVYTPYRNAWLSRMQEAVPPLPAVIPPLSFMPSLPPCGMLDGYPPPGSGGEPAALRALTAFVKEGLHAYHTRRDSPATAGTSGLSPYLACGAVSVRTVLSAVRDARNESPAGTRSGAGTFTGELIWREFFHQIMEHFPRVSGEPFREEFSAFRWHRAGKKFASWCRGNTGYPIVDAGMRQLIAEGWMHNRVRMIVASFLVKDLHVDWRLGEEHFFRLLADADTASNNGNWQWVAGTGTDAAPYFRIFNPVLQGRKFDPAGAYVRRYVPGLARVPDAFIHAPWEMSAAGQKACSFRPGTDYPLPIVNHAEERAVALRMFAAARGGRTQRRRIRAAAGKEEK